MKMQDDVRVTIRVDRELKEQADTLFDQLGMNMSVALNVFLRKAVDESAIPFPVSRKSAALGAGYSPADITSAFAAAVHNEITEAQTREFSIARYDAASQQAYLEFADGSRGDING